jgi:hypothetical protein
MRIAIGVQISIESIMTAMNHHGGPGVKSKTISTTSTILEKWDSNNFTCLG